ncbi:DEAD/DEAH box helicase family protein [Ferviditalea candida]|uniref:DEAD/DEAH box helicase family protein n=1 Tax=Ferviditalea candida TaxID=3108399 RepID=A0ABU5ZM57_9BACL|nr:DEAD/DEAH box helicase family protein [Paenibacillaceae bacterium T2]
MPDIKLITENLADELIPSFERASGIYILTSFVMESGVRLLQPYLKAAAERGAEIKILAGDYLFVTQPQALRRLLNVDGRIEARLWRSYGTSFHPKAYLFDYDHGQGLMIVGSSNLSISAFKLGYEWNLAVNAKAEPYTFQEALNQFMHSFYHEQTITLHEESIAQYEKEYLAHYQKFPEMVRIITEHEESDMMIRGKSRERKESSSDTTAQASIQPRPAQQLALDALESTWEEGYDRAMVVMATGLGKTYLAGFFAKSFRRVLFIAHREEILLQAQRSFQHIMPERSSGLYNGMEKDSESDCLFASIYTLGMKKHRERFSKGAFDLIIVDEFHHAAAKSYTSVLEYFRPRFLLGITATPDRMDGKDVYALCDGNVAYQIRFIEAIARGWLSPFQYYGVYDDTDYGQITWLGSRYDEEELLAVQLREEMAERVYVSWVKYKQTRTLGFCSSIRHADFLASYFRKKGAKVLSLHSQTVEMSRSEAIRRLAAGELDVIFTVDLFNEGVDIPSVDTLLFARPTESLTVFTQQVGRGLRLSEGKSHCAIIDLIGNYRNADLKLSLFQLDEPENEEGQQRKVAITAPPGCLIDLEIGVVNLLEALAAKKQPRKENLLAAYRELKQELGRRPSYLELHLYGKAASREYHQEFRSYVGFLNWAGELREQDDAASTLLYEWTREICLYRLHAYFERKA